MRALKAFFAVAASAMIMCVTAAVSFADDSGSAPVYPSDIAEGTYTGVSVKSSSSMFKVVDCELTVADGGMTAVMTLSGTGYGKLYMGTAEDAESADESEFIPFAENADGKYTYTVPVTALDTPVKCAAWSIRKKTWYDRDLVFRSESLPDGAVKVSAAAPAQSSQQTSESAPGTASEGADSGFLTVIVIAAVCVIVICAVLIAAAAKRKKNDK